MPGLSRESLYKALSGHCNPTLETVLKVIGALGLKLRAEAAPDSAAAGKGAPGTLGARPFSRTSTGTRGGLARPDRRGQIAQGDPAPLSSPAHCARAPSATLTGNLPEPSQNPQ